MGYLWTEDVWKLTDNIRQAKDFQSSVEKRLVQDISIGEYNKELKKSVDKGAISRITQEEMESYCGPVSYVTHHGVLKWGSVTTPLRIVTNTSLKNRIAGISPD